MEAVAHRVSGLHFPIVEGGGIDQRSIRPSLCEPEPRNTWLYRYHKLERDHTRAHRSSILTDSERLNRWLLFHPVCSADSSAEDGRTGRGAHPR